MNVAKKRSKKGRKQMSFQCDYRSEYQWEHWHIGMVKEDCCETELYNRMEEKGEIKRGG